MKGARVGADSKDSLSTKMALLIFDKLALGLLLAIAGFIFNYTLQNEKIRGDSQKSIFEQRISSYLEILQHAKESRDYLARLYLGGARVGEIGRREQLERLAHRVNEISSGRVGPGRRSGGSIHSGSFDMAFDSLFGIEKVMRENEIYISDDVRASVGTYLDTVVGDLEKRIKYLEEENKKPANYADGQRYESRRNIDMAAWGRAEAGYQRLRDVIYQKLAVERLPIG